MTTTAIKVPKARTAKKNEASAGLLSAIAALSNARSAKRAAEKAEVAAKADVLALLAGRRMALHDGLTVVEITSVSKELVDPDVLRTAFPEAFEAAKKTIEYDVIRVL